VDFVWILCGFCADFVRGFRGFREGWGSGGGEGGGEGKGRGVATFPKVL
jgi:hypothetical protein